METQTQPTHVTPERIVKPRVDIVEQADGVALYADMPGVAADAIDITLEKHVLTIHGKSASGRLVYQRAFTLSQAIDRDRISAAIQDGVLTLALPKAAETTPTSRRIVVKTA